MRTKSLAVVLIAILALGTGCDDDGTLPPDAPEGHTVSQDGVAHMPGFNDPMTGCTACHGADLMGGDSGEPSCFSCHGRVW